MITAEHSEHIRTRVSHAACSECRADGERRHVPTAWTGYKFVHEYLEVLYRSKKANAQFREALDRRITNRVVHPWRKLAPGYLERLRMALSGKPDAAYLRYFAQRKASALDYY